MTRHTPLFRITSGGILYAIVWSMSVIGCAGSRASDEGGAQAPPQTESVRSDSTVQQQPASMIPDDPGFASIKVLAQPSTDSIVLRWAPTTPHGWRIGNRIGYVIERQTPGGPSVLLTQQPILPWEPEPWAAWMEKDSSNALAGIAVYALYGDTTLIGIADSLGLDTLQTNAERNANLFGYALFAADNDPDIAGALGLRFVDKTAKKGIRYTYTISLARPQAYRVDPGTVDAATGKTATGPAPQRFIATGLDGRIHLRWEPAGAIAYSAYNVFRSENRGRTYIKLNATPIAIVIPTEKDVPALGVYVDSTIVNYTKYRYQVKGIDAFGETGKPAEAEAYGRDLTAPPQPMVKNAEQVGPAKLRMSWELPDPPKDVAGFNILRSAYADSSYKKVNKRLLPPTAREYVDEKANDREPYYVVAALDTAGNTAQSFPLYGMLIDTIPPAMPTGLRGSVDSLGHVRLRWNRNREANVVGYRVLRANAPEHEFTQLMGSVWRDTSYVDSIDVNSLTRNVYYRIAAVNARFGHSPMTAPLALRRQNRNLPTAPIFTDVIAGDGVVELHWAVNSEDKLRSIAVVRRVVSTARWDTMAILPGSAGAYIDRRVVQNTTYEYEIAAVDMNSQSIMAELPVLARPYDSGVRPPVRKMTAALAKDASSIQLAWTYQGREADRAFFIIYRSFNDGEFISLKSVSGALRLFADRALIGDGTYRYRIQAATQSGAESALSEPVTVVVGSRQK